jgi:transposase|tara:strand:+ start:778 stop:927 length:150 start_codon:yes stop_codon:yes gene_type:complete
LILGFGTQIFYGALFERIVAKGKSKKLALLAMCNKLLKQEFAIVKSGVK